MKFRLKKGVSFTQARGCNFCLHIGRWVWFFGEGCYIHQKVIEHSKEDKPIIKKWTDCITGSRLELCTPRSWFRFTPSKKIRVPASNPRLVQLTLPMEGAQ